MRIFSAAAGPDRKQKRLARRRERMVFFMAELLSWVGGEPKNRHRRGGETWGRQGEVRNPSKCQGVSELFLSRAFSEVLGLLFKGGKRAFPSLFYMFI
jgi:hypothetical protein